MVDINEKRLPLTAAPASMPGSGAALVPLSAERLEELFDIADAHREAGGDEHRRSAISAVTDSVQQIRHLMARIDELQSNISDWGIIEIAVRNDSVQEYMAHWEGRALKAEKDLEAHRCEIVALREAICSRDWPGDTVELSKVYHRTAAEYAGKTIIGVEELAKLKRDAEDPTTINQRDRAEDAADKLTSEILGEPIDWSDHSAKWEEALDAVVTPTELANLRSYKVEASEQFLQLETQLADLRKDRERLEWLDGNSTSACEPERYRWNIRFGHNETHLRYGIDAAQKEGKST